MLLYLFQTTYVFDVSSMIFTITVDVKQTISLLGLSFCIYGYCDKFYQNTRKGSKRVSKMYVDLCEHFSIGMAQLLFINGHTSEHALL